jgi:predicted protein tyrosine phosphatase
VCYECQWLQIERQAASTSTGTPSQLADTSVAPVHTVRFCKKCKVQLSDQQHSEEHYCQLCRLKKEVNEVYPGVFITDYFTSQNYEYLKSIGIKQILTIARELKQHDHPDFVTMHISIDDSPMEDIKQHFAQSHEFIEKAPTLVHCYAGISRSGSIVVSYVIRSQKMNASEALRHCKRIRPKINPNYGFITQLIDYAEELGLHSGRWAKIGGPDIEAYNIPEVFQFDEELLTGLLSPLPPTLLPPTLLPSAPIVKVYTTEDNDDTELVHRERAVEESVEEQAVEIIEAVNLYDPPTKKTDDDPPTKKTDDDPPFAV